MSFETENLYVESLTSHLEENHRFNSSKKCSKSFKKLKNKNFSKLKDDDDEKELRKMK